MTKKEILDEALLKNGIPGRGIVVTYPAVVIDIAMEEFAKQQVVGFVHWTNEREWYYDAEEGHWFHNHYTDLLTNDQMYSIFTEEQAKKTKPI